MTELLQQLINGLALGAIYALIALGYTMVYGVLRFINFAHGDVFMLGAFSGYYLSRYAAPGLGGWRRARAARRDGHLCAARRPDREGWPIGRCGIAPR